MTTKPHQTGTPKMMQSIFGIMMIVIYLGMGALFFFGFFDILFPTWGWVRWVGGGLFTAYGLWRAYRQFAGIDPGYGNEPKE